MLVRLGVAMTDTCINYQTIQAPTRGEHLAFGDEVAFQRVVEAQVAEVIEDDPQLRHPFQSTETLVSQPGAVAGKWADAAAAQMLDWQRQLGGTR